jgi:preprotein translocase subunit YajC
VASYLTVKKNSIPLAVLWIYPYFTRFKKQNKKAKKKQQLLFVIQTRLKKMKL